ncbi:hypothetical protein LY90DRAFT_125643 [Neocallimastix californiae]|uniref:Uncharacterized protein n=1 Tax=Neocallimastix californiae TaxID=1754190 RepID=A0A1Y2EXH6_9FUNG|nr:hypothetical protein LY90DRAFT_125643 [Neocallimastix californiae]|eukprot:ORY75826.1 hypothetical protein LY90DRAFT_125643 [Neocallimastix californiae]
MSNSYNSNFIIQSPSNLSISSHRSSITNEQPMYENSNYDKTFEYDRYHNNDHSNSSHSPNFIQNRMNEYNINTNTNTHTNSNTNINTNTNNNNNNNDNKYMEKDFRLPDIQTNYKSLPSTLSSYHLQSQSNNSSLEFGLRDNSCDDLSLMSNQIRNDDNKSYQNSNSSNTYFLSKSDSNNYLYSQSQLHIHSHSQSYSNNDSATLYSNNSTLHLSRNNSNHSNSSFSSYDTNNSNDYYSSKKEINSTSPKLQVRSLINNDSVQPIGNSKSVLMVKRKNSTKHRGRPPKSSYNTNNNTNRVQYNKQDRSIYSKNSTK